MLIEFSVTNFRSIKARQTISMVAAYRDGEMPANTVHHPLRGMEDLHVLRSAGVYGPNAAGKSNLVEAMRFMRGFVRDSSAKLAPDEAIVVAPFLLDPDNLDAPSEFEVVFGNNGVRYQYGFAVTKHRVESEWLYAFPAGRVRKLFTRQTAGPEKGDKYTFSPYFSDGRELKNNTRPNALFVSTGAQFNQKDLSEVYRWFSKCLATIDLSLVSGGISPLFSAQYATEKEEFIEFSRHLLRQADLGIEDVSVGIRNVEAPSVPASGEASRVLRAGKPTALLVLPEEDDQAEAQLIQIRMRHGSRTMETGVDFDFLTQESAGTQRLFALLAPWYDALREGKCLFADEIGASMHPLMTRALIKMIHDPEQNTKGAQLVFCTHDTTLLDNTLLRRDQLWFVEKDEEGATHLYPLSDYKPRPKEALQKGYLAGRYGAIPFLGAEFRF